jgi:hypothetical protein
MVDWKPGGPRPMDQAHGILSSKINLKFNCSRNFATRPLGSLKSTRGRDFALRPLGFSKLIQNLALATSINYK